MRLFIIPAAGGEPRPVALQNLEPVGEPSWMPDGRALIAGGTLQYPVNGHGWGGIRTTTVFDPATEKFILSHPPDGSSTSD